MRVILVFIVTLFTMAATAQTVLPGSFIDYSYRSTFAPAIPLHDSGSHKKWSFSRYTGLSAGYSFFKGGSASVIAAPVGLQINRKLTNNLYAFAGVFVTPAYIHFNGALLPADITKMPSNNSFLQSNSFGIYSRAELGLMYINPEKTFSISGSIGIERSNTPQLYYPVNAIKQNIAVTPNR